MGTLEQVRNAVDRLVSQLGLAAEEPQAYFDQEILVSAAELEDGVCREFSLPLVKRAVALRLALKSLVAESSPESFARVLNCLSHIVEDMSSELAHLPEGRAWRLSHQFHEVARHLASPTSAENQGFRRLPEMLYTSTWLQLELGRQLSGTGLSLPSHLRGKEFRRHRTRQWLDETSRSPAGALAARLDSLRGDIEFRARQIWYLLRSEEQEADLSSIYVWAHEDLYPHHHQALSRARLVSLVAGVRALASTLDLPDLPLCLESADWLAQYAMNYLMPPAPNEWAVEHPSHVTRVLNGRLSRWYFHPFSHRLQPIEMMASVLRVGRPLFYERSIAHAILEYSLLQGAPVSVPDASIYLDILAGLERDFVVLFDGYLLRQVCYQRLRTPEGWCDYLDGLTSLHFRGMGPPELAEFRTGFLAARGLRSPIELLYRVSQTGSPVN